MKKPIERRPVYYSSKYKGRPATGSIKDRYTKVDSAKTLGSELAGSENQFAQSNGVINYGQIVSMPFMNQQPNSLHRFMKRSDKN